MPILVSLVLRPAVYTRWLHLAMGGIFAGICVMVAPGFDESLATTLLTCLVSPLPVLALAAFVPVTRHAEGVQARLLLKPQDSTRISVARSRTLSDLRRTGLWLLLRVWFGVAVLALTVNAVALAIQLMVAPLRQGPLRTAGIEVLDRDHLLLGPLLVPPLVLVLLWIVVAVGELQVRVAQAFLGPSPAERLAEVEHRAGQLLERNRLAAELHDSIGHALTVTVLQAGAARQVAGADPAFVERALTVIEETGRRAMDDLERTLGILRDTPVGVRARPTLADLDALLDIARAAGAPVTADVSPRIGDIPGVVSQEAYRILQEAVTNALRHAPGCAVVIDIGVDDTCLDLRVVNAMSRSTTLPRGGKGLRGLRERAILLGGEFSASRQDDHWTVDVRLPTQTRAPHGDRPGRTSGRIERYPALPRSDPAHGEQINRPGGRRGDAAGYAH
ncbi:Integral membrane sensor signal transduction histidine kinase [Frankia canadensis]|uniref:histidine kinase n=1 Tax=Frankia canadensis TaxID=1836972 RepID=A0A2I2KRN2_9ACTN|nr:histidine kinase [Frankia canadensis]SNQ48312.1 Integral membrane sensor signal transduction histidine kinase [Frankia canadensis]SOU55602.1 Integral membrane sensor signal transduction histidine kinase [Frankia canadensis]